VDYFKTLIQKKNSVPPQEQRLIYGGKQLQDGHKLSEYPPLGPNSTIFLVLRLPGGGSNKSELRPFPVGIPSENSSCSICFSSPSIRMPCSHLYCPTCVVEYSWNEANSICPIKTEVKCSTCEKEWGLPVIKRYGSVSDEEMDALINKLSNNFIKGNCDIKECPGCRCYFERIDRTKGSVYCRICAKQNKTAYYCFHCSRPWKNNLYSKDCGNPNCTVESILELLRTAPKKDIIGVKSPSIRLCPKCGCKIEHKKFCKTMKCKSCLADFCFICLRTKQCGVWQCGGAYDPCVPAPVQTVIPQK